MAVANTLPLTSEGQTAVANTLPLTPAGQMAFANTLPLIPRYHMATAGACVQTPPPTRVPGIDRAGRR